MIYQSPVYSEARGSIAGITYSRNAAGLYTRARAVPVNPNTVYQAAMRQVLSQLTALWRNTLTQAQRDNWTGLGQNLGRTNKLGDPINLSGNATYVLANAARIQAGMTRLDDLGDNPYGVLDYSGVTASASEATQLVSIAFATGDTWVNETGSALAVYVSYPKTQSINYFTGPYRYAGVILGDGTTPPTSPQTISAPFPFAEDDRLFVRTVAIGAGGAVTPPFRTQCDAAA